MERENRNLKILVVILCIMVLGLGGYFLYDKVLSDDNNVNSGITNEDNSVVNEEGIDYNLLVKNLNEVFDVAYDYYNLVTPYCGNSKYVGDVEGVNHIIGSYVSEEFNSYDEMLLHLKKYMSEEVISNKTGFSASNRNFYVEKEGKLYCELSGKGGSMLSGMYSIRKKSLQINGLSDNKIDASILIALAPSTEETIYNYNDIDVIFEKQDDNWIITSFEIVKGAY